MPVIDITIKGAPRSTNTIYKTMCRGNFPSRYMSNEGKATKADFQRQIKQQYKGKLVTGDIDLIIKLYFGNKRKNDIDNFNKILLDSMTGIIYEDDSQIQSLMISKEYDKKNPRIELVIDYQK